MSSTPFTFRTWSLLITLVEVGGGEMVVVDNFCCGGTIKLEPPPKSFNPPTFQAKNSDWCLIFLV